MHTLRNIDIRHRERILPELYRFVDVLKSRFKITSVHVFGSFVKGKMHEGSDIDLLIVGDFHERYFDRVEQVIGLTELPIEPVIYSDEEYARLLAEKNPFVVGLMVHASRIG